LRTGIITTYLSLRLMVWEEDCQTPVPPDAAQVGYGITSGPNHTVGTDTTLALFGDNDLSS
jgi:hypothetical protein